MFLLFLFIVLAALLLIFLKRNPTGKIITDYQEAIRILKSPNYVRCVSNEWMIESLSIINPFTIDDENYRQHFKQEITKLLVHCSRENEFHHLLKTLDRQIQRRLLISLANSTEFNLSIFVQQICLNIFLSSVLKVTADDETMEELADLINRLWKNPNDENARNHLKQLIDRNSDSFDQSIAWKKIQNILIDHRQAISYFVQNELDEKIRSPLNIIVPGWETMWRVVFYTLLELLRRGKLLIELRQRLARSSDSVRHCLLLDSLIKETLRLYPPTKSIYRHHAETNAQIIIDVKEIHRNRTLWGSDALEYRANRFVNTTTTEQNESFLAFSISCPARHGFAYKFAGAILSTILRRCEYLKLVDPLSAEEPLSLTRDSYRNVCVTNSY